MSDDRLRILKAVLKNALLWGLACGALGGALVGIIALFDPSPAIESLPERLGTALFAAAAWGVRFGVWGGAIGALFALALRFGFRGRRLAELSSLRFALIGAVIGGAGVPLLLQGMNVLFGGGPIAWNLVTDDGVFGAVFGGIAAGGTILLARRAAAPPSESGQDLLETPDAFGGMEQGSGKVEESSTKR